MTKIPTFTRKELYDMTTTQLYELHDDVHNLENMIIGELMARGDY